MVTIIDHAAFWRSRFALAMESAHSAPSERSRTAYLELAHHYWSMHEFVNRAGQRVADPLFAAEVPAPVEASEMPRSFSVHDALMRVA